VSSTKTLFLFAVAVGLARAQPAAPPAFEVASVKQHVIPQGFIRRPWSANIDCGPVAECGVFGKRFSDQVASLTDLLMDAYSIKRFQISGLPDWGDSGHDVYDIEARIPGDGPHTVAEARPMLQTLLAERFQLKIHHQTKELPVYALVPGKNGTKLKPADKPCALPMLNGGEGRGGLKGGDAPGGKLSPLQSWSLTPEMLSMLTDRPVIDKSGLKEASYCTADGQDPIFVVIMQAAGGGGARGGAPQPDRGANADPGASVFTLVEEKWGMKLESQKAPVDMIVIDHVERPSGN
jgi:uncharacterized protein (TIGR03435 family)